MVGDLNDAVRTSPTPLQKSSPELSQRKLPANRHSAWSGLPGQRLQPTSSTCLAWTIWFSKDAVQYQVRPKPIEICD